MHTYITDIRFGGNSGTWQPFHPLVIEIEPIPGTSVLPSGTIKLLRSDPVVDGQIQLSADGKTFTGWITTGTGQGPVDYRGSAIGTGTIVGVGRDQNLRVRTTLNDAWHPFPSGDVIAVAVAASGDVFAIGKDKRLLKRERLNRPWSGPLGSGSFKAITAMGDGLLGVGTDDFLYTIDLANDYRHSKVPDSRSVTAVAVTSSEIFGIGTGLQLHKRKTLNSPWSAPLGSGKFKAITAMGNGLLGVGTDDFLYTIDLANDYRHSKVSDSGLVLGVACYP